MSGISGIIYKNQQAEYKDIKVMNGLIVHRGPDGEGFYLNASLALGHRRLFVQDYSNEDAQPMCYKDLVISFDGKVANRYTLNGYTYILENAYWQK